MGHIQPPIEHALTIALILEETIDDVFPDLAEYYPYSNSPKKTKYLNFRTNIPDTKNPSPLEIVEAEELKGRINLMLLNLTPIQKKILELRYWDTTEPTLKEVGIIIGKNTEKTRQLEAKAIRTLQYPANHDILKDYAPTSPRKSSSSSPHPQPYPETH